jgi:hypothetical protein
MPCWLKRVPDVMPRERFRPLIGTLEGPLRRLHYGGKKSSSSFWHVSAFSLSESPRELLKEWRLLLSAIVFGLSFRLSLSDFG